MLRKLTQLKRFNNYKVLLAAILLFSAFSRLYHLDYPRGYVFDEVYHAFTAKEYVKGDRRAWEWWNTPPPGVAYEWTHPPLAKELMAASLVLLHSKLAVDGKTPVATKQQNLPFWQAESFGYRLPGVLLGILSVFLVCQLGELIFKSKAIGLISAFVFSVDGLNFVQSRTGMNDIYIMTFVLLSLLLLYQKKFVLSATALGLAIASKWSGGYFFAVIVGLFIDKFRQQSAKFIYFLVIPVIVYLLMYVPFFGVGGSFIGFKQLTAPLFTKPGQLGYFIDINLNRSLFLGGHSWNQFVSLRDFFTCQLTKSQTCPEPFGLQNQMYYYHTNLQATHNYASPWWSWPLNLYPVWYFVDYHPDGTISNIFASGNPVMFWLGFVAVVISLVELIHFFLTKRKLSPVFIPLLSYLCFWLPWIHSPRIMFLYHYSPSVPFMALLLGYQLYKLYILRYKTLVWILLGLVLLGFAAFYPWLVGIPLPQDKMLLFFRFSLTKNPFGA